MTTTQIMSMGPSSIVKRYTISFGDLTSAGTTQTITLDTLPKGHIVKGVRVKTSTAFAGGGNTAVTVSVGSAAGSATTFTPVAYDIFQAVADTTALMVSGWKAATYAADTLQAFFTTTTGVCSGLTAGQVFIDVELFYTEDLTATGPAGNQTTGGGLL